MDAAWERRAERPMLVLALVFLVVLVVPMVADLPPAGRTAFTWVARKARRGPAREQLADRNARVDPGGQTINATDK